MEQEQPRFLAKTLAYARFPTVDALEAVSEAEQARQTKEAHARWRAEQARAWGRAHAAITSALGEFAAAMHAVDSRTSSDLRAIERTARRIEQRVAQ